MSWTIYPTVADAIAANQAKAAAEGCDMVNTTEWWARISHPTTGQAALEDGVGSVTHEQLAADGWFDDEAS